MPLRPAAGLISLALVACASGGVRAASAAELPAWYAPGSNAYPSAQYAVGRGACGSEVPASERAACAVQRATEDALLQVRARVTAVRERTCRLESTQTRRAGVIDSRAQSACSSVVGGHSEASLEVSDATPREQSCDAEHCFALIALSRVELAERIARATAAPRASFDDLVSRARTADLLLGLSLLGQAEGLAGPLDETGALLAAVGGPRAYDRNFANEVSAARRARLLGVSACLQADAALEPTPERIFAAAGTLLAQQGVNQVQLGSGCQGGGLIIDYAPSESIAAVARPAIGVDGLWTMSYAGRIRISAADGSMARERRVEGRGVSRSVDAARHDAENRLAGAVRAAVAELVLGQHA